MVLNIIYVWGKKHVHEKEKKGSTECVHQCYDIASPILAALPLCGFDIHCSSPDNRRGI